MLRVVAGTRQQEIARWLEQETKGIVQSGPFQGMKLTGEGSWGLDGDYAPKVLGTYEIQLHHYIEMAIAKNPKVIENIGCAEGYYAVGLACRLPGARIFAYDSSTESLNVAMASFKANHFKENFYLSQKAPDDPDGVELSIIDVEGAELEVLSVSRIQKMKHCDVIVECHDYINGSIAETLEKRFEDTHDIFIIPEGPRDPSSVPLLNGLATLDQYLAMCENRPCSMKWIAAFCRSRE